MQWGLSFFPQSSTKREDLGTFGLAISSQTQHPEAAWRWLSFLSRQMIDYMMPVRRSVLYSTQYEDYIGPEITEVSRTVLKNGMPSYLPQSPHFEGVLEIFSEAVTKIKSGVWSAEEAMYWAQQQAETRFES
jgi:ABC-type glycerol-3-phosphate transport system substrate-binding protein